MITSHDLLYRAVITRGSAKLECFVGISTNYPTEMPLCALELSWNGRHNADNNAAIKVCFKCNFLVCHHFTVTPVFLGHGVVG